MAVVFLALNGDGLGHLVRVTTVCEALAQAGERPVIFSQGIYPLDERSTIPGKRIPSLWKASKAVRRAVSAELRAMTEISRPSVLVEDTHPNPVALPAGVRRVLMVRPTAFAHLAMLNAEHGGTYASFLLCDHPDSPTWPYAPEETVQILGWAKWRIVGPIYRTAGPDDIATVRRQYKIADGQRVCVFSLGGGGRHLPGDTDAERFVGLARDMADRLRRLDKTARMIFVKGPYFPADVEVRGPFEVVEQEPRMPALLALADGVFTRAGFNTPWECISAGTPFLPFVGTTVNEPVEARIERMRSLGLVADSVERWFDPDWRAQFERTCEEVVDRYSGAPDGRLFQALIVGRPEAGHAAAPVRSVPSRRRRTRRSLPLAISVEAAAAAEPALTWLLQQLSARGLKATLGVVPYLVDFDAGYLDGLDPERRLFEIAQHGHAGLSRSPLGQSAREFTLAGAAPPDDEAAAIDWGRERLRVLFPTRWTGGFQPPFDGMPSWLPSFWQGRGEAFVCRRVGTPLWQAGLDSGATRRRLRRRLAGQAARRGHLGIVLRPRDLREAKARANLVELLDILEARGVRSVSVRDLSLAADPPRTRRARVQDWVWALGMWSAALL